jgi:hypothetical protein
VPNPTDKTLVEIGSLARAHTKQAVEKVAAILNNSTNEVAIIRAAELLLDRGWGKPKQTIAGDPDGGPLIVEIIQRVREPKP